MSVWKTLFNNNSEALSYRLHFIFQNSLLFTIPSYASTLKKPAKPYYIEITCTLADIFETSSFYTNLLLDYTQLNNCNNPDGLCNMILKFTTKLSLSYPHDVRAFVVGAYKVHQPNTMELIYELISNKDNIINSLQLTFHDMKDCTILVKCLRHPNNKITYLDLSFNAITDDSFTPLIKVFTNVNCKVTSLNILNNLIQEVKLFELIRTLKYSKIVAVEFDFRHETYYKAKLSALFERACREQLDLKNIVLLLLGYKVIESDKLHQVFWLPKEILFYIFNFVLIL